MGAPLAPTPSIVIRARERNSAEPNFRASERVAGALAVATAPLQAYSRETGEADAEQVEGSGTASVVTLPSTASLSVPRPLVPETSTK